MDTFLWILQWLLAALFAFVGVWKVASPYERLSADPQWAWTNDFTPAVVKEIGVSEVAAASGLVLPGLAGVATVLTPLAAVGLVIVQLGALATSVRRGEKRTIVVNVVLILLAGVVGFGRFVLEPLG
jgi:hypothetical protein